MILVDILLVIGAWSAVGLLIWFEKKSIGLHRTQNKVNTSVTRCFTTQDKRITNLHAEIKLLRIAVDSLNRDIDALRAGKPKIAEA